MIATPAIKKYLQHYAEPETAALAALEIDLPGEYIWSDVVVIPACNETSGLLRSPPPASGRSLMILVINQTAVASSEVCLANRRLFDALQDRFEKAWCTELDYPDFKLYLFKDMHANRDVLLVDKFSPNCLLPPKGGVGHARKIGADLATSLIQSGRIASQWIRCTDADVHMPGSYFSCTAGYTGSTDISALIYPFHHGRAGEQNPNTDVVLATQLYEHSLYYYVAALKAVSSPYAFQTIGSTIAIDVNHYAKVRGVPRREAGEDFYLLNKLAKSGEIRQMEVGDGCQPIAIQARLSDRVPFGTGAAVSKMTALDDVVADYRFYDPRVFGLLGLWLQSWSAIWASRNCKLQLPVFELTKPSELLEPVPTEHEVDCLIEALRLLKTEAALQHAFKQSKSFDQFGRQMHVWFDAFRSLKLIHTLREQLQPSVSFDELCKRPEYRLLLTQDSELNRCHGALRANCRA